MNVFIVIYTVALLSIAAAGIAVYRCFAGRGRLPAAIFGLLAAAAVALFWPIPIHGGFTFIIAELYDEIEDRGEHRETVQAAVQRDEFVAKQNRRFRGVVEFAIRETLADNWYKATLNGGVEAWYDAADKLLWSGWLPLASATPLPPLDSAKQVCRNYPPRGYWSLANEAENSLMWKAEGYKYLPKQIYSSVSFNADESMRSELPFYGLRNVVAPDGQSVTRAGFAVRCVALAAGAPPGGYREKDISLADWNAYQLNKLQQQR